MIAFCGTLHSYTRLREGVMSFVNQTNFERYIMILKSAGVIRGDLIRSKNVVNFGYILYLLLIEKCIRPDVIERQVRRWVVMSIITQRYTSSPESAFDFDIRRLNNSEDIIASIDDEIARQLNETFWSNILVERFNTSVASSPYWKIFVMAQIKLNDRGFLSRDINVRSLIENRGDVHHIFPKNYLKKNKHDNRGEYNQIANFAMLQTEVNIQISDRAPEDYMKTVLAQCNGKENKFGAINDADDLKKNLIESCIPEGFENMTVEDYNQFLKARRILMANKVRKYFESL